MKLNLNGLNFCNLLFLYSQGRSGLPCEFDADLLDNFFQGGVGGGGAGPNANF